MSDELEEKRNLERVREAVGKLQSERRTPQPGDDGYVEHCVAWADGQHCYWPSAWDPEKKRCACGKTVERKR